MATFRSCSRDGVFCTLCCATHGVPEIAKLPFTTCCHCIEREGCAAHHLIPGACSQFRCAYLRGLSADDTWPQLCGFVQEHRSTCYGHTWIMSAEKPSKLDTAIARREMIGALERDLVVVLEKPGWTVILCADNRDVAAVVPRGEQRLSVTHASAYLGCQVSARPYVYADLGTLAWHPL